MALPRFDPILYGLSIVLWTTGSVFASVPLYKIFCSAAPNQIPKNIKKVLIKETAISGIDRNIKIIFGADVSKNLKWEFKPEIKSIKIKVGQSILTFFNARNLSDSTTFGISTYSVSPYKAAKYFNKIQCFCFEKQQLDPKEQVEMPVFFFIDQDFLKDNTMNDVDEIYLSYSFLPSS